MAMPGAQIQLRYGLIRSLLYVTTTLNQDVNKTAQICCLMTARAPTTYVIIGKGATAQNIIGTFSDII
jgi:hypothetical protein